IPLRRGVVAGGAVGRLSPERSAGAFQTHLERQVRGVHDAVRSGADAGTALGGAQLAVRRGTADRRGDAPAHPHGGRALRQGPAQPGRRAAAPHRALHVRLQEHQVEGADPVKKLEHECGKTALNFLMLTLTVTPVRELAGLPQLLRLRRMLGLFAFFYAVVHFTVYLVLDLELNFRLLGADIVKRPYITIGFSALLLLL